MNETLNAQAIILTSNSLQASMIPLRSISVVQGEYLVNPLADPKTPQAGGPTHSICNASILATLQAFRNVAALHSLMPKYLQRPALRSASWPQWFLQWERLDPPDVDNTDRA